MFSEKSIINQSIGKSSSYTGPVKLYLPTSPPNKFHAILGLDEKNQILRPTNSFLEDPNFVNNSFHGRNEYDKVQTIFTRLESTYSFMKGNTPTLVIEQPMFLLVNPFSSTNIGHDLSILFHRIVAYRSQKLTIPVVIGDVTMQIPRAYEILQLLLPDTTFYTLPSDTYVLFKKLHVTENCVFDIQKHGEIIQEIIEKATSKVTDIEKYKNKKVFLVKSNFHKNVVSKWSMFQTDKVIPILEEKYDYICINPEIMNMYEIISYVYFAKKIVTSFGAILYAHAIFFGKQAKLYYLQNDSHKPYWGENQYVYVKIPLDLNSNIEKLIQGIGEDIHLLSK